MVAENFALIKLDRDAEAGDLIPVLTKTVEGNALQGQILAA